MQDLNDKITGNDLTAAEWNQVPSEIQNVIEGAGITLSGIDFDQLGKAIASYIANGDFYTDSGAADAYVLSVVGSKQTAPAYTDGFRIRFVASNSNAGTSTVNVATLGVKTFKREAGTNLLANDIRAGELVTADYDLASGFFILVRNVQGATETREGISKIATQGITDTGTNDTDSITPLKLRQSQQLRAEAATHEMVSDAGYTLTSDENKKGRIIITDVVVTLTGAQDITLFDTTERLFIAQNDTDEILTFKTSAGSGIAVGAGSAASLICDGVDVIAAPGPLVFDQNYSVFQNLITQTVDTSLRTELDSVTIPVLAGDVLMFSLQADANAWTVQGRVIVDLDFTSSTATYSQTYKGTSSHVHNNFAFSFPSFGVLNILTDGDIEFGVETVRQAYAGSGTGNISNEGVIARYTKAP